MQWRNAIASISTNRFNLDSFLLLQVHLLRFLVVYFLIADSIDTILRFTLLRFSYSILKSSLDNESLRCIMKGRAAYGQI